MPRSPARRSRRPSGAEKATHQYVGHVQHPDFRMPMHERCAQPRGTVPAVLGATPRTVVHRAARSCRAGGASSGSGDVPGVDRRTCRRRRSGRSIPGVVPVDRSLSGADPTTVDVGAALVDRGGFGSGGCCATSYGGSEDHSAGHVLCRRCSSAAERGTDRDAGTRDDALYQAKRAGRDRAVMDLTDFPATAMLL